MNFWRKHSAGCADIALRTGALIPPTIELEGRMTRVLVEQTTAVSMDRLGDSVGRLTVHEMRSLDEALAVVFGL